jgi:hypothetical protein
MTETELVPVVEEWIRDSDSSVVNERQRDVWRQLRRFEDTGQVASVEVNVWGECVQWLRDTEDRTDRVPSTGIRTTYRRFEEWATAAGYDLEPGFDRSTRTSLVSPESHEVIVFPLLCLAVYVEGDVHAVFPCLTESRVWTLEDGLAILDPTQPPSWSDFETSHEKSGRTPNHKCSDRTSTAESSSSD